MRATAHSVALRWVLAAGLACCLVAVHARGKTPDAPWQSQSSGRSALASPAGAGPRLPEAASRADAAADSAPDRHAVRANGTARRAGTSGQTAQAVRIVVGLTALAILPALLICLTAFLRIVIVLSMLRHSIGMPETPPNPVLLGLALFLTLFAMAPVAQQVNVDVLQPFMEGSIPLDEAYRRGSAPLRDFMVRQTREQDLALMVELSKAARPETMADISNVQLIPAFMLSELRGAFQIGFLVFLPFLLVDLIVSSVLMALGMMMMPPTTVALPIKILLFILVDGWALVIKSLMGSFH